MRVTWMRVGLLIACVLSAVRLNAQETPVFVDVAVRQVVQQMAMVSARVVTATQVIVSSRVAESIASVNVQLGDRVAANRSLVSLSTDDLQRDLRTLEGRMAYLSDRLSLLKEQEALRVGQLSRAEQLSE